MYSLFIARYLSHVCFSTWRCDVVANNSQQRQHTPNPTAHLRIYCVEICKAFWLRLCHLRREHMNQRNKTRQIFSSDLRRNVHDGKRDWGAGCRHAAQQFLLRFRGRATSIHRQRRGCCVCLNADTTSHSRRTFRVKSIKKNIYMENKYWNGKRLKCILYVFDGSTWETKKKLRENQNIHKYFFLPLSIVACTHVEWMDWALMPCE